MHEEHSEKELKADLPEGSKGVINIYICTPHRLLTMMDRGLIKLQKNKMLKYLILDCSLNVKMLSLMDINETRVDTLRVCLRLKERIRESKLKLYLH